MAKKNITKILEKGSHKQRAALLFVNALNEDVPETGKRTLTKEEERALDASFSAPGGASVFNEYKKAFENIRKLSIMVESAVYAYGKDTLFENLMLERFIQAHNYRALHLKLKKLNNEEVNSLLESTYRPPFTRVNKEGLTVKEEYYKGLFEILRARRKRSLSDAKTFEAAIEKLLAKYNLKAATAFTGYIQQIVSRTATYESALAYALFDLTSVLITERIAYLRAYSSKEKKLKVLEPLLYENTPIDTALAEQIEQLFTNEKDQ